MDEILKAFDLTFEILGTFGFTEPVINLSTLPGQTILDPEMAERATQALTTALDRSGLAWTEAAGEGTFYGPKVDFHFRDAIRRLWQLTTVQCDFALPEPAAGSVSAPGRWRSDADRAWEDADPDEPPTYGRPRAM